MHSGHSHQGHSHGHDHGQNSGHTHHAGCSHAHGQQHEIQPEQYFKQLQQLKKNNIQFYWMQVLKGAVLAKYLQQYKLGFLNSINAQFIQSLAGMVHMMLTCDWMPLKLRPFISGIFWPFVLYVFVNYKIITGFGSPEESKQPENNSDIYRPDRSVIEIIFLLPILLYSLTGMRSSGSMVTSNKKKLAKKILQIRPYLQNPGMTCTACQIPKAFRAMHCPVCKICVPKFSRHSLVFGVCIGAANQLFAILFFLSMTILSSYCLIRFTMLHSLYGIITQVMLYALNISILWMSTSQFITLFILNINFGLTEFEIQNWMMLQYLMKVPARQFLNSCKNGIVHNMTQDIFAAFRIAGYQSQVHNYKNQNQQRENQPLREDIVPQATALSFPQLKEGNKYIVNWDKAYFCVIPHMPNHPKRKQIIQMMKVQEPRMVSNFKLMNKFRNQLKQQNPQMTQFQLRQKAMLKMSQHMAKNPQMANIMKPPPEQQKAIQLQMLGHMKMQFKNDTQIFTQFQDIQNKLKTGAATPDQTALRMRTLQQKVMQKKMKQIMEAQKLQQAQTQSQGQNKTNPNQQQGKVQQPNLQSLIQAQILQQVQQRSKQISSQEAKSEQKKQKNKPAQKQQESDKLKEQVVDDENL